MPHDPHLLFYFIYIFFLETELYFLFPFLMIRNILSSLGKKGFVRTSSDVHVLRLLCIC